LKMLKCFIKAMWEWGIAGFPIVEYQEYWYRRIVCRECSQNWPRCPICGCWLFAYAKLGTSHCKNWRTGPSEDGKYRPTKEN